MRKFFSNSYLLFALFFILGTSVVVLCGVYSEFHAQGNDFWTVLFYGRNITWARKESLYNGFYPFGYAFLIGQLPYTYAIQLAYIFNAILAGLFVASVSSLIAAQGSLPATLLALAFSISEPMIFQYANTPGPDIGAAAFPAFAVYLLWKDSFAEGSKPNWNMLAPWIGASLGLGFLWRAHVVVLAVIILILAVVFRILPSLSANLKMIAAFLAAVSIQVFVNLISGHAAFETAQSFNVYKFLYGVNWVRTPTPAEMVGFSVWNEIVGKPLFVISAALPYLKYLLSYALPSVACFVIAPKGTLKRFALFSSLSIAIYAFPLSLGDSPRAPLPILGLYLSSFVLLFIAATERLSRIRRIYQLALIVLSVSLIYQWGTSDYDYISKNRASHRAFLAIERVLVSHGMKSPNEVFSNKYQFYLPSRPPYLPRQINSWSQDWFWGFSEQYPLIPNASWESFRSASIKQGIKFLVLSPTAAQQGDFFSAIYGNQFDRNKMGVEFVAERVNMRIYQFIP